MNRRIAVTALLGVGLMNMISCAGEEKEAGLMKEIVALRLSKKELKIKVDSLTRDLNKCERVKVNRWFTPQGYEEVQLKDLQIENPERHIEEALRKRQDLIPSLVNTTENKSFEYQDIQVLGANWVVALLSDGHTKVKVLYNYTIDATGVVNFNLLDTEDF